MPIAIFASKTFQVSSRKVYTFTDLSLASSLQTEKQDVAGKKPSTYSKGPDLDTLSFSITLDASQKVDIRREYESWVAIKDAEKAYPFILGGRPVGKNKWQLKSVSLSNTRIDAAGNILSGTLQLQFDEYVRAGSASASSSSTSKGSVSVAANLLTEEKKENKRVNPNAAAAMAKGVYAAKQQRLMEV